MEIIIYILFFILFLFLCFIFILKKENDSLKRIETILNEKIEFLTLNNSKNMVELENNILNSIMQEQKKNFENDLKILTNISKIEESQANFREFKNEFSNFQKIYTNKKHRGQFGEFELYQIIQNMYGDNDFFYEKQSKLSNGYIVDLLIKDSSGIGNIAIDSKFPLENYLKIYQDDLKDINAHNLFKQDINKHLKDIARKYIIKGETANFALMFLPSEAIYNEIYINHLDLVEKSYQEKVYFVSPSSLVAYLNMVKTLYLNVNRQEKIKDVLSEISKLSLDYKRFNQRYETIYKDFEKIYKDFNELNVSVRKIIKHFDDIENLDI